MATTGGPDLRRVRRALLGGGLAALGGVAALLPAEAAALTRRA